MRRDICQKMNNINNRKRQFSDLESLARQEQEKKISKEYRSLLKRITDNDAQLRTDENLRNEIIEELNDLFSKCPDGTKENSSAIAASNVIMDGKFDFSKCLFSSKNHAFTVYTFDFYPYRIFNCFF